MALTDKGKLVLGVLVDKDTSINNTLSSKEVADFAGLGPRSVPGVLTSLVNKGLVGKTEDKPRQFYVTDDGLNYEDEATEA